MIIFATLKHGSCNLPHSFHGKVERMERGHPFHFESQPKTDCERLIFHPESQPTRHDTIREAEFSTLNLNPWHTVKGWIFHPEISAHDTLRKAGFSTMNLSPRHTVKGWILALSLSPWHTVKGWIFHTESQPTTHCERLTSTLNLSPRHTAKCWIFHPESQPTTQCERLDFPPWISAHDTLQKAEFSTLNLSPRHTAKG